MMSTNIQPDDRSTIRIVAWLLGVPVFTIAAAAIFWASGGVRWLDTKVFPPHRPQSMPLNSIWIEAPPQPISWHHGSWFGCSQSGPGTTNYCRLVGSSGEPIYAGEYVACSSGASIPEHDIHLVAPPNRESMWLFREGSNGPVGFLLNGDILVPVDVLSKCDQIRARPMR
jgi:hypothetical protein